MFNHCPPIPIIECPREVINGKRHYVTPDGNKYPSITTVLSAMPNTWLQEWKDRVGEEEVHRRSSYAAFRGTNVHTLCEKYLKNEPVTPKTCTYDSYESFLSMKKELNKINNIHCQEASLYSHKIKIAGSVDCIAEYDGVLSVIDFKTSAWPKTEDKILSYFIQATFYAIAYEEMTGEKIEQVVILIMVDNEKPQVFIKKPIEYISELVKVRKLYAKENSK